MKLLKYWKPIIVALIIFYGSVTSSENLNKVSFIQIKHLDKIVHLIFYFSFTLTILTSLFKYSTLKRKKQFLLAITISVCYGLLMEFIQYYFTETRMAEILDIFFNIGGCLLGVLTFNLLKNTKLVRFL
ncbi:MAG: VanZ family protein [Bacteroidales bacterium]|nr:VanZ family protein [Bacteroidales bacterium]